MYTYCQTRYAALRWTLPCHDLQEAATLSRPLRGCVTLTAQYSGNATRFCCPGSDSRAPKLITFWQSTETRVNAYSICWNFQATRFDIFSSAVNNTQIIVTYHIEYCRGKGSLRGKIVTSISSLIIHGTIQELSCRRTKGKEGTRQEFITPTHICMVK